MSNEIMPVTKQSPGVVTLENYDELKSAITEIANKYKNITYSLSDVKDAKSDKAELNKLKKAIQDRRKEIKAFYMAPYHAVEEKFKELEALLGEPYDAINSFVKEVTEKSKLEKKAEIKRFFDGYAADLGELADQLFESDAFFDTKWLNASTKASAWQSEIKEKLTIASKDINTLQTCGGIHKSALINKYLDSCNMEEVIEYHKQLKDTEGFSYVEAMDDEDNVIGYKVLKINTTRGHMAQLLSQFKLLDIEYEEIEDAMPADQTELTVPDFDSFVAFDIETSGSYGASHGDAPAEITEIGAVKVINGEIVDRVDWLCNPGRKITPKIVRLTHITDEMVANEPPVGEIIKKFAEYAGDLPLVGHNIKSSDLHYISRSAKKAGVAIENPFFDTYIFANKLKKEKGWEKTGLGALSDYYKIELQSAHRAYCDAEANAYLYFKLKEESEK